MLAANGGFPVLDPAPRRLVCSAASRSNAWTDATLSKELKEFMSVHDMPGDTVPTVKLLDSKGRQDLAKAVRRRGYRAIAAMLAQAESDTVADIRKQPKAENGFLGVESSQNTITEHEAVLSSQVQAGGKSNLDGYTESSTTQQDCVLMSNQADGVESVFISDQADGIEKTKEQELQRVEVSEPDPLRKVELLTQKLEPLLVSSGDVMQGETESIGKESPKEAGSSSINSDGEFSETKSATEAPSLADTSELGLLTRELNEAKAQLALVQAKSTAELAQAKQAVFEKEVRLNSAEHALANLKQVKVEWWGKASKVELAGSFNGWQHLFPLKPDITSQMINPDGTRGALMWEAELWLYPGVYEIKFIVDGEWQIDHRREIVMKNMNTNNILRVEV